MNRVTESGIDKREDRFLRSFGRRKGRGISEIKQALIEEQLPTLAPPTDLSADQEYWLEIGFGAGEHLLHQARHHPEIQFIGAEPYMNGVAALLYHMQENPPQNLHILADDVRPWMQAIPEHSLTGIYILFPDPWPKRSHHKRRIINTAMLALCCRVLKPGGLLRIATDHVDYSAWMFEHLLPHPGLHWTATSYRDWHQPFANWQQTRYQRKTTKQGREPIFLEFQYNGRTELSGRT